MNETPKKQSEHQTRRSQAKQKKSSTLYDSITAFCRANQRNILIAILGLAVVLGGLLFDVKLSTGGDDSAFVLDAMQFVHKGIIPVGFKSPGYPIFLGLFILVGGLNVILLKLTSVALFLGSIVSFYFIFKDKLEPLILNVCLVLFAANVILLQYSHSVYSEMLYLPIQLWGIYFLWKVEEAGHSVKSIFLATLVAMIGYYARALGGTLLLAIGAWFLIQRKWKSVLWFGLFGFILYLPLKLTEIAYGFVVVGQAPQIFMVNPYEPTLGMESVSGLLTRTINNIFVNLNYIIPKGLGLPSWEYLSVPNGTLFPDGNAFISTLLSIIVVIGLVRMFRKGTTILPLVAIYTSLYILFVCLAVQNVFMSIRHLVPIIPLLEIPFFIGLEFLIHKVFSTHFNKTEGFKRAFVFGIGAVMLSNGSIVVQEIRDNLPVLGENLAGNEFAGFSADWVNYLKACRWISRNLPKDSTGVICRKPELFQIYSGDFYAYGTYNVESTDPDTIVNHWKSWKMTHLLYDNFQWSTTLRRYVRPVAEKYPKMFDLIHQEGTEYPSFIYRLDYSAVDSARNAGEQGK